MPPRDPLSDLTDPNRAVLNDPRIRTFLDDIGRSEGADYNTLVGGSHIKDLSRHPNKVGLTTKAGPSTAFGKYQIVHSTHKSKLAKYADLDYSPENQDLRAVELLRQTGALDALLKDDRDTAIKKAGREWASLPGSTLPGRKNYAAFKGSTTQDDPLTALTKPQKIAPKVDPLTELTQPSEPQFTPQTGRVTSAPKPTRFPRGVTKGTATSRNPELVGQRPQISLADLKRREEQRSPVARAPFDARKVVESTIMDYQPSDTLEAQAGRDVLADEDTLAGNLKHGFDVFTDPIGTFTKSRGQRLEESIASRIEQQKRASSPEVVAERKDFGSQPAPIRAMTMPAGRAGAGIVKMLAGLSSWGGVAPNEASDYLNKRATLLEDAATLPPLNAKGEEIVRGLPEKATGAVLDIGFTVAQLIAMKKATGMSLSSLMATETALKTSDKPVRERSAAIAHAYGMGKILDQHLSRPVSAALFGGPTAVSTGLEYAQGNMSLEDALLQTGVETISGAVLAPKRGVRGEATNPELRPLPSEAGSPNEVALSPRESSQSAMDTPRSNEVVGARPPKLVEVKPNEAKQIPVPSFEGRAGIPERVAAPTQPSAAAEPVRAETAPRHVDLQPRRQRGESRGQFKPESRAEKESRRQQVQGVEPTERPNLPLTEPLRASTGTPPIAEGATTSASTPSPAREVSTVVDKVSPRSTVVRNESLRADRAELGLPELERQKGPKAQETFDEAVRANTADPRAPDVLVEQALRGGKNWTDKETLQVGLRTQEVKNRIQQVKSELVKATDAEVIKNKSAELEGLVDEYAKIHEAGELAGAEWSAAGRARQVQIGEDYTYKGLIARAKSKLKRDLTPEEREKYQKQADRIVELETQLATATERATNNRIQGEIKRIQRQTKRGETKAVLDEEFASLKSQLAQAQFDIKESGVEYRQGGIGLASLDPSGRLTPIIARMAKNRAKAGVNSAEKLIDEVYYAVKSQYDVARDDVAGIIRNTLHESDDVLTRWDAARQKRLVDQIVETRTRTVEKDFSKRKREPPIYNRETARLQRQIDETKVQFNREMYRATRSMGGKISDELAKAANVPKTIKSMGDISAVFRQGGYYAITHPIQGGLKPAHDMLRSFSDAGFRNVENKIKNHPKFQQSVKDGVEYTGVDKADPRLSKHEEGYLGGEYIDLAARGKYNYLGKALKGVKDFSERTFVSFLDSQRLNMYDSITDGLANPTRLSRLMGAREGLNRTELAADRKRIAKAINSATGRGNLGNVAGVDLNQAAPLLNIAIFSPRLLKSRVELLNNMFNPVAWANMPRNARAQILQDNVKFIGATIGVLTLAKALGADVNYDPDDSDFLKIRVGNTTYDTLTGLQQPLRFILNMGAAVDADAWKLSSGIKSGFGLLPNRFSEADRLRGERGAETYAGKSKGELVSRFARSKLSPIAGTATSYIAGEDFMGRKFDAKREARDLVTPLPASDIIEAFKEDGIIGSFKALPSLAGIGVGTYPVSPEKPTTHAEKLARRILGRKMPDEARDQEEIDQDKKLSELRSRARKGEDVLSELQPLVDSGKIKQKRAESILNASGSRLSEDIKNFGLNDALIVYDVATPKERQDLLPILVRKKHLLYDMTGADRIAAEKRLAKLGIPDRVKIPPKERVRYIKVQPQRVQPRVSMTQ